MNYLGVFAIPLLLRTAMAATSGDELAKTLTPEEFEESLKAGLLVPKGPEQDRRDYLTAAASIGADLLTVNQFIHRHPQVAPIAGVPDSELNYDVPVRDGRERHVILEGKAFRLHSLAMAIRTYRESGESRALLTPPLRVNRRLSAPSCDRELGHGVGSDRISDDGVPFAAEGLFRLSNFPLKSALTCVRDQGARGTSAAFATASAVESATAWKFGKFVDLSKQALHNIGKMRWERDPPDSPQEGFWSQVYLAQSEAAGYRIPFEEAWDYNPSYSRRIDTRGVRIRASCEEYPESCSDTFHQGLLQCVAGTGNPVERRCGFSSPALHSASGVQVLRHAQIWDHADLRASVLRSAEALTHGVPIVLELAVTQQFASPDERGFARMDLSAQVHGYTSVAAVAFVEYRGVPYFIVKNSWGTDWGDNGYAYLPADYVMNHALSALAVADVDFSNRGEPQVLEARLSEY